MQCTNRKCGSAWTGNRNGKNQSGNLLSDSDFGISGRCVYIRNFPNPVKHNLMIRRDTLLIGVEILVVIFPGFIPDSFPVQISQVAINFIASIQFNTFRQVQGTPVATTSATNHIRQIGIGLAKEIRHRNKADKSHRVKLKKHFFMLLCFLIGAVIGTAFCNHIQGRAIWITAIPLICLFGLMVHDDKVNGKEHLEQKPLGH